MTDSGDRTARGRHARSRERHERHRRLEWQATSARPLSPHAVAGSFASGEVSAVGLRPFLVVAVSFALALAAVSAGADSAPPAVASVHVEASSAGASFATIDGAPDRLGAGGPPTLLTTVAATSDATRAAGSGGGVLTGAALPAAIPVDPDVAALLRSLREASTARGVHGTRAAPAAVDALSFALDQVGIPYVWGAVGPGAYDCSGLMLRAYATAGVALPRVSADQYVGAGAHVGLADLLPGDLVFFATAAWDPGGVHHVGMYVGRGLMVNAPRPGSYVRVEPVPAAGYVGAVRPVPAVKVATRAHPKPDRSPPAKTRPKPGSPAAPSPASRPTGAPAPVGSSGPAAGAPAAPAGGPAGSPSSPAGSPSGPAGSPSGPAATVPPPDPTTAPADPPPTPPADPPPTPPADPPPASDPPPTDPAPADPAPATPSDPPAAP